MSQKIEFESYSVLKSHTYNESDLMMLEKMMQNTLGQFFRCIEELNFDEKPNYSGLKNLITDLRDTYSRM
jgi:hypothetical protein